MGRPEDLRDRLLREGVAAIDAFIHDRVSEELFLDFKRSSDNAAGRGLSQNDRSNLAKAISGFGNSEGGIVIWGVDCSPEADPSDVAKSKVPLVDCMRFVSWLEGAVSGCTIPPHQGVTQHAIQNHPGPDGFALTYVPRSSAAPHQVVGKNVYYIRAGSNFLPAPHGVLAGLFGRAPQPDVFLMFLVAPARVENSRVVGQVGVCIRNNGPGIASDLFVNALIPSHPGTNCQISANRTDTANWGGAQSFGFQVSLISQPGFRLPPEAQAQPLVLEYSFAPPFSEDFKVAITVGSGGSVPYRWSSVCTPGELDNLYKACLAGWKDPAMQAKVGVEFASAVFREAAPK